MGNYRLIDDTADDLSQIADYYADKSPAYCDELLEKMTRQFELLVVVPKKGRARDELLSGLRSVTVSPYVVYYRVVGEDIEILRVIHGSRDITPGLFVHFE